MLKVRQGYAREECQAQDYSFFFIYFTTIAGQLPEKRALNVTRDWHARKRHRSYIGAKPTAVPRSRLLSMFWIFLRLSIYLLPIMAFPADKADLLLCVCNRVVKFGSYKKN